MGIRKKTLQPEEGDTEKEKVVVPSPELAFRSGTC